MRYFTVNHLDPDKPTLVETNYDVFKSNVLDHENHVVPIGETVFMYSYHDKKFKVILGFELKE